MNLPRIALFAVALAGATTLSLLADANSESRDQTVRLNLDVDRGVLPADRTERAVLKIGLDGIRLPRRDLRPPVNVALVIDKSGSMTGDKIAKAREAAIEAVHRLAPDDIVSVVVYDSGVRTLVPAQPLGNGRRVENAILEIEASGNTALHGGVVAGAAQVRRYCSDGGYVSRIILLSDGLANVGPSSVEELGRLGASLLKEGISVTTIGLGLGYNEDLMTCLAQRSDGNTYFVEHSSDLPRIFAAELGDVLSVVARRVVVDIEFPDSVRPLCFVGRDGTIHGQQAQFSLNQLYGGQEKFALIEVEVAPAKAGVEHEIARARVSFENALRNRTETLTARRTVQFSANRSAVVASADHAVQRDYAANVIALAKDEAVALVDANQREAAGARLRQKAGELKELAQRYDNAAVLDLAAAAAPEADRLEREGLSNEGRKIYRAESAAIRSQQATVSP